MVPVVVRQQVRQCGQQVFDGGMHVRVGHEIVDVFTRREAVELLVWRVSGMTTVVADRIAGAVG